MLTVWGLYCQLEKHLKDALGKQVTGLNFVRGLPANALDFSQSSCVANLYCFLMNKPPASRNRIRIIGGDWRSRQLQFPDAPGLRPTPDRVRETLFNWWQYTIIGKRCLDLFAGSGALGFEALSRGASVVVALETDSGVASSLRSNAKLLGTDTLTVMQHDALQWLAQPATQQFDLAFVDPPFAANLHERCCELLQQNGWLAPGAQIYLEAGNDLGELTLPCAWQLIRQKRAGDVHYGLATLS
jgi:16S rRNA (guanine966-N2)-methyltransferase